MAGEASPHPDGPLRPAQAWRMVITKWPLHPASSALYLWWLLDSEGPGFESSLYHYLAVQTSCLIPLDLSLFILKWVLPRDLARLLGGLGR